MYTLASRRTIGYALTLFLSVFLSTNAVAQSGDYLGGYKQIKRLGGTSQSICRPAIRTADELQSFALNQRQDVVDILQNAEWTGNPDDVFAAIEAGDFAEKSYPVGTKLEWMGMREKGNPIASPKREWAGKQDFEGFELNLVSNCQQHQLVIPKACCNVSLIQSTPIDVAPPVVAINQEGENVTISVDSGAAGEITTLTHPDGTVETLQLTDGTWSGTLPPGDYSVESRTATDCGESAVVTNAFNVAAPVAAMAAAPRGGLFFAPFVGRQLRAIDPPLVGLQVGYLGPITERLSWLVQGGGSYNLKDSELSLFADVGLEHRIGENGFIGGGVGYWDLNNTDENLPNSTSPKDDITYFVHGGAGTPWTFHDHPIQWFAEARIFDDFTDDISNHNILKLGLRITQ